MDYRVVPIFERISPRTSTTEGRELGKRAIGILSLLFITILWGSSFPIIKIVVSYVNSFCYIFYRNLIALLILSPYIFYKFLKKMIEKRLIRDGLITGLVYTSALWLQGWGTEYTSATCSAFITGLNVVFVHLYTILFEKKYSRMLILELALSVSGLYLITKPSGGALMGNMIVLVSSILWAVQVILISRYAPADPITFTYFELVPSLLYLVPTLLTGELLIVNREVVMGLIYLALTCTVIAFTLQAYGQRYVSPEVAAIIYLLEPVVATVFSYMILGEKLDIMQLIGAVMIILSITLATIENTYISERRISKRMMNT
ncbi:MAG: DMT family transporter [Crenarchaeota archaeon]|nr:DMT family transporter [Thermoproteota archaeon]